MRTDKGTKVSLIFLKHLFFEHSTTVHLSHLQNCFIKTNSSEAVKKEVLERPE